MVFEEFFKKKRIDLAALQQAEGSLFSEFKDHFEQMGEKSFDHTKKYWFNKLRRRFPIAVEIKTEKVHIQNPIAEQTITESLIEPGTPVKIGFTPKFRAAVASKPAENPETAKAEETEPTPESNAAKPVFKPRFNPGMVKPKPADDVNAPDAQQEIKEEQTPAPAETPAPKPAFKPRFNAAMVKPKLVEDEKPSNPQPEVREEPTSIPPAEPATPKPGFKPRFNAAMIKPKPAETEIPAEAKPEITAEPAAASPEETQAAKPAYKPRFNPAMAKPRSAENEAISENTEPEKTAEKQDTIPPADEPAAKPAYKPRFNMKNIPPKTGEK